MGDVHVLEDCSTLTIVFDPKLKALLQDKFARTHENYIKITKNEAGGLLAVDKQETVEPGGEKSCTLIIRIEKEQIKS